MINNSNRFSHNFVLTRVVHKVNSTLEYAANRNFAIFILIIVSLNVLICALVYDHIPVLLYTAKCFSKAYVLNLSKNTNLRITHNML